ncbi:unnamed protein product, partial [Phaeothamnion confervicola]
ATAATTAAAAAAEGAADGDVLLDLSRVEDLSLFVLKISDMGLGKQLLQGQSSFGMASYGPGAGGAAGSDAGAAAMGPATNGGSSSGGGTGNGGQASGSSGQNQGSHVGSVGWQAPEVIRGKGEGSSGGSAGGGVGAGGGGGGGGRIGSVISRGGAGSGASSRRTQAVDVFSLGCVFYYCLDPGGHPFGESYERELNIIRAAPRLDALGPPLADARHLVGLMLAPDPADRPTTAEVCRHPFFWDDERRLAFLMDLSDRLEQEQSPQSPLLCRIEAGADAVVGRSWDLRLGAELLEHVGRYRKYDYASARDLLRVVRNKRHHFHELPPHVQEVLSPLPVGLVSHVNRLFPELLMHCFAAACDFLAEDRHFQPYL